MVSSKVSETAGEVAVKTIATVSPTRAAILLKVKEYVGVAWVFLMIRWIYPSIDAINQKTAEYSTRYQVTNEYANVILKGLVVLGEAAKLTMSKIIALDVRVSRLTDALINGNLSATQAYILYAEILISIVIMLAVMFSWHTPSFLPLIGNKDISIQSVIAYKYNQNIKDFKTLQWTIIVILLLWELYHLNVGDGFVLPFDGLVKFIFYVAEPGNLGYVAKPILTNVTNATVI